MRKFGCASCERQEFLISKGRLNHQFKRILFSSHHVQRAKRSHLLRRRTISQLQWLPILFPGIFGRLPDRATHPGTNRIANLLGCQLIRYFALITYRISAHPMNFHPRRPANHAHSYEFGDCVVSSHESPALLLWRLEESSR